MLQKLIRAFRSDPVGFPARTASAAAEQLRLRKYRLRYGAAPAERFTAHYGVHRSGNAGDTALFVATRKLWDQQLGAQSWRKMPVRAPVTRADIDYINAHARGIVLGGGGLIIPDSVPGSRSGWQWNLAIEDLRALQVPLFLSAVGYNVFHGQTGFSDQFRDHINETISRARFVGLRNRGSITALRQHLAPELGDRLRFQPCPTTILSHILPPSDIREPGDIVSLNLAFDRAERRFGGSLEASVAEIARAMIWLTQKGYRAVVALHDPRDRFYLPLLRNAGLRFTTIDLANASFGRVVDFYRTTTLTLGMRGHGQMVPFGLGKSIFTLSSHPKMNYFLEDIGRPDWGVDIREPGFQDRLIAGIEGVIADLPASRATIAAASEGLYAATQDNFAFIKAQGGLG